MTDHTINFSTDSIGGNTTTVNGDGSSSSNRKSIVANDRVRFRHLNHEGSGSPTSSVTNWTPASAWDNTSSLSVPHEGFSGYRDSTAGFVGTADVTITCNGASATAYFDIVSSSDTTPDPFSLPAVNNANPNVTYYVSVRITGINTPTNVSISNTLGHFKVNDGTYRQTLTQLNNNDIVTIRMAARSGYNQARSITLTVGTEQATWTITTRATLNETKVELGITSGTINLSDIKNFFGGLQAPDDLTAYYKDDGNGGAYVPDISPDNDNIPTSGIIDLTDFYGSASSFYFEKIPDQDFSEGRDTSTSAQSISVSVDQGTDYWLGYGPGMSDAAKFRMEIINPTVDGDGGSASDVVLSSGSGSPGSWSSLNDHVQLDVSCPAYTERIYRGTVRLHAQHGVDTSVTTYIDITYDFVFFGP